MPEFAQASERVTAQASLPGRANGLIHVEDRATGVGIDIAIVGANDTPAQVVDGYVVYAKGHALGSIYQRAEPSGVEDYVLMAAPPAAPSIAYDVALGAKVAGLRLVESQLEMLDKTGAPRLRLAPPYIVGNDGEQTQAVLAVEGCAVDTDPAGPWERSPTSPGARRCRVIVSWTNDTVRYPALLDPRWQTTGNLSVARQDHSLVYLPLTGKVLAAGGRSSPTSTTGLASAELYDKTTGTWSATASMTGGRWSASATLLNSSANATTSRRVLVAGGKNGTTSLSTAQLYNQTAGTWAAAANLNASRHVHTATLLADGRVLVCGGMNGTAVLTSAALYNPASGSGAWVATTGPIPPPGLRFGTATLIQTSNTQLNNKVLLAGGNNGTSTISAVFLFDPAQSAFSTLASMPSPREGHQAVKLSDGRILFTGGKNGSTHLSSTVIFDPSWGPGNWTAAANMTSPRWGHAMNLLPSDVLTQGLVLVSGGTNGTTTLSSTEYWNGTVWAVDGAMVAPVQQHASVALDKRILIAGGAISNGATTVSASEVYDPSIGLGCTSNSQCASGFCVAGVCCDSPCTGGCGACNLAGHLGTCTPVDSGLVCRPMAGGCDVAEACDGASVACPADALQPATTECRPSAGSCDLAESCTGNAAPCPPDGFEPETTVCRASVGICDIAEHCTGTSAVCAPNEFEPPSTVCRAAADACDAAESCTGTSGTCPPDEFQPENTECRQATSQCDVAERCSGSSVMCPADTSKPNGTACDDGSACTKNDTCTSGTCGGEAYNCEDGLQCTQDSCNGDGSCTFAPLADGVNCDDGNVCTKDDACQGGVCGGSGSGYVGPGELCGPPNPGVPGPFGDFHCVLEELPGVGKNILTIGNGVAAKSWILRGTMGFSFTASGARLTKVSMTGQADRHRLAGGIVLKRDSSVDSIGTADNTSGNVELTLPTEVILANGIKWPLLLNFTGKVADRILQGEATAPGEFGANVKLFCRQQFRNVVATARFTFDSAGAVAVSAPVAVSEGIPSIPAVRSIPAPDDLVVEFVALTGEIIDQYGVGKPWLPILLGGDVLSPGLDFNVRAPLSNRLATIVLRKADGPTVATADVTQSAGAFCAAHGAQYCDYLAGTPVRTVLYAPATPPPALNDAFPSTMLPSSPRLDGGEVVLSSNYQARQPDVALDAEGNAVVVWREGYSKIMAMGISKAGNVQFGPLRVNSQPCAVGWIPGDYPPPDATEETGDLRSQSPVVAMAKSGDHTFAVAWGSLLWLYYDNVPLPPHVPFLCTRVMRWDDGAPVSAPSLVAPSLPGSGSSIDEEGYVDIAMAESHEYVLTWHELPIGNGQFFKVAARRFGANGMPKTVNAVVVNDDGSRDAVYPAVAMDNAGNAAITWTRVDDIHPTPPAITGHAMLQRFNSSFAKMAPGNIWVANTELIAGRTDVAMQPSSGDILVSASSKGGDIGTARFRFSDGGVLKAWQISNARGAGQQERPRIVVAGDQSSMLTWMDEAALGGDTVSPITAQVYRSNGLPLDVDFTASARTAIYTDPVPENPGFYNVGTSVAFGVAASQTDFAIVWQRPLVNSGTAEHPVYEGGIVMQRVRGGATPCPSPNDCSGDRPVVPLRIAGNSVDNVDIVLTPGVVIDYHNRTQGFEAAQLWLTPQFSEAEFAQAAVGLVVNGLWANNVFSKYAGKLNIYYQMATGFQALAITGYLQCSSAEDTLLKYEGNSAFADVGAIITKDWNYHGGCTASMAGSGYADGRRNDNNVYASSLVTAALVRGPSSYSTLVHELGHAVFGTREEYYVQGSSSGGDGEDTGLPARHSNVFATQESCAAKSAVPSKCEKIPGSLVWYSDENCAMDNGETNLGFGKDCEQRARCWMEDVGCTP